MEPSEPQHQLISVIIPTYNHGHYLGEAIESVLQQTYPNIEIVIVDNYSDDNTADVISGFTDSRIKHLYFRNEGVIAASRNYGVKNSSGEVLAFLDSDDVWKPEKLEKQIGHLFAPGISLVASNFDPIGEVVYCRRHFTFPPDGNYCDYTSEQMLLKNCVMTSSAMVLKVKFNKLRGFSESRDYCYIEDWEFWLRLVREGDIRILQEPLINYRIEKAKERDKRDVAKRALLIIDEQEKHNNANKSLLRWARGNIYVDIGRAHLFNDKRVSFRYYWKGLISSKGLTNKLRAVVGISLLVLPYILRQKVTLCLYRQVSGESGGR